MSLSWFLIDFCLVDFNWIITNGSKKYKNQSFQVFKQKHPTTRVNATEWRASEWAEAEKEEREMWAQQWEWWKKGRIQVAKTVGYANRRTPSCRCRAATGVWRSSGFIYSTVSELHRQYTFLSILDTFSSLNNLCTWIHGHRGTGARNGEGGGKTIGSHTAPGINTLIKMSINCNPPPQKSRISQS